MLLQTGTHLQNRYRLLARLGKNGLRETWKAEDTQAGEVVILKMLYFNAGFDWQEQKLFERQAKTLQSLQHPGIPHYRDCFWEATEAGNLLCLIYQFIPGETLQVRVERTGPLPLPAVIKVAQRVLEILSYLHRCAPPVIHRDIKPSNLIWNEEGQVFLIDFGAVQAETTAGRTFTVVGTYGYMPPEQFGGQTVPASDLYALGATLLYLLTGQDPADLPRTGQRWVIDPLVVPSESLRQWLSRLLEADPRNRFLQAEAALAALEAAKEPLLLKPGQKPTENKIIVRQSPGTLEVEMLPTSPTSQLLNSYPSLILITPLSYGAYNYFVKHRLPDPLSILIGFSTYAFVSVATQLLKKENWQSQLQFDQDNLRICRSLLRVFKIRKNIKISGPVRIVSSDKLLYMQQESGKRVYLGICSTTEDAQRLAGEISQWLKSR